MRNLNILITLFLLSSTLFGQMDMAFDKKNFPDDKAGLKVAKENIKDGDEFYYMGQGYFKNAIEPYLKANAFNPNNAELNMKIGVCYLSSPTKLKSLPYLEKAHQINPSIDPKLNFYLGEAYHLNMDFDKAISCYSKYQKTVISNPDQSEYEELKLRLLQCKDGKELVKKPIRVFVDNLGPKINTKYNEYGAVVSADESVMVFTARRPSSTGGKIDEQLNEHFEDIYISEKLDNGEWSEAKNVGRPVNSENHDANSGLSADGQKFVIFLGRHGVGDLYESTLEGTVWGEPESMGKNVNTKHFHESSGCYSPDGNLLYFVSNKEGGYGKHDIYISRKDEKGRWGEAENIGDVINTPNDEEGVYMHPDGKTLYFSSQGHGSMGGYDIFKSIYNEETQSWGKPINIGYPVNTTDDDIFFVVSANGRRGYYTSVSSDGYGGTDLYVITFLGPEKPMVLNNEDNLLASRTAPVEETVLAPVIEIKEAQLTILKGVISDALTQKLLGADIELVDNTANQVVATFKSNEATGKYLVSLPAGKNYGIAVKKEGYLFHSENFDVPDTAAFQTVVKNIELKGLKVGSKIVLRNIFFDLDKATLRPESTNELNRLIKLMNDVPTLEIELSGHTDSQGSESYNQSLSERRAKAVVDYLVNAGISKSRLVSKGYGEMDPIDTNDTPEGRQMNRRTEFKVLKL